jgi:hypothetical protein
MARQRVFRDETATRDMPRASVGEARTTRIPPRAVPRAAPLPRRRSPGPGATPPGPTAPRRERASRLARAVVNARFLPENTLFARR